MSEFNFDEDWSIERTQNRIDELQEEINETSRKMNEIDSEMARIKKLQKKKDKLAKKMSHNMRYRNALIDDLYDKKKSANPT